MNGKIIIGELDGTDKCLVECSRSQQHQEECETSHIAHKYNRDAVRRERNRDREIMSYGISEIVHFDFSHVANPRELESMLISAGVPKIAATMK